LRGSLFILVWSAIALCTRIGLVAAGLGVTFVPAGLQILNYPGVVYKPLSAAPKLSYGIAWSQEGRSPLVESLLNMIQ
jgi:DNA-binding transcriptional LysR family regulator